MLFARMKKNSDAEERRERQPARPDDVPRDPVADQRVAALAEELQLAGRPANSSSSARAATPSSATAIARDVVGPRGLRVRAVPRRAVLLHPRRTTSMGHHPVPQQISPMGRLRVPGGAGHDHPTSCSTGSASGSRASAPYFKNNLFPPGVPKADLHPGTPIEFLSELHLPAVHPGGPALRQHVRRPPAASSSRRRHRLPVHRRGSFTTPRARMSFLVALVMTFFELLVCACRPTSSSC